MAYTFHWVTRFKHVLQHVFSVHVLLLLLGLYAPAHAQTQTATGLWSYPNSGYLVLLEDSHSNTVIGLHISTPMSNGSVWVGNRASTAITLRNLMSSANSMSLNLSGNTYTGTQHTSSGSTDISGQLVAAYQGSANDGIYVSDTNNARYIAVLTATLQSTPLSLLFDIQVDAQTQKINYDIAPGSITPSSTTPSFLGKSLINGNTLTLSFKGGSPAKGFFSSLDNSRPPKVLDQFNVTMMFKPN